MLSIARPVRVSANESVVGARVVVLDGGTTTLELARRLPRLEGHEPVVIMHNDAVIQGLSEVPNMKNVHHWGVLTIGTGLGNARYTNREDD